MFVDYIDTPLGAIEFKASEKGVTQVIFAGEVKASVKPNNITAECKKQLHEYFAKTRTVFNLPLDPKGTDFQKSVWCCLSNIPYGKVVTYLDIAQMVNKPWVHKLLAALMAVTL
ncbi:methylated-DNA--[protein]-cysteine S-methyltransferase [Pseudoalteromonas aliena]|uniref:methylated-DNA--[protein]-cysteine S-methyltransferase n=1 Tax=Pseudoalteromonas aliena TaxID=247523 RepID=UPI001F0224E5|nr:MGMT family protein [Pseudoalteromonas aliena]